MLCPEGFVVKRVRGIFLKQGNCKLRVAYLLHKYKTLLITDFFNNICFGFKRNHYFCSAKNKGDVLKNIFFEAN